MTDHARRPLTEQERGRIQAAKARGEVCARCGRALAEGEPVWMVKFDVHGDGWTYWRALVGRECVAPDVLRQTADGASEPCVGCGRAIRYGATTSRRRLAICSKRCARRHAQARAKGTRQ